MWHKVIAVGNLGRDPEMQYTAGGQAITNFSIATSERWTDQDNVKQERTTWWRVSVFGKRAESCKEYLRKGSRVLVEGTLSADPKTGSPKIWNDKEGVSHASYEIRASDVRFLSSKSEQSNGDASGSQTTSETSEEESIPF